MASHIARPGISPAGQAGRLVALGVASLGVLVAGVLAALTSSDGPGPAVAPALTEPPVVLARSALDPSGLRPPAQFRGVDPSGTELAASDLAEILGVGDGPRVTQAALGDLGFERVRTRAWRSATDELLVVTYEFTRPQGARTFTDLVADAERGGSARALPLPGSRGARAVQFAGSDDPAQVAFLHDGAEAHVVALVGPSAAPGGRLLGELLTAPPSARP